MDADWIFSHPRAKIGADLPPNVRSVGCDACRPTRKRRLNADERGEWYLYRSVRSRRSRRFARVASGGGSWKIRVEVRGGAASWGHGRVLGDVTDFCVFCDDTRVVR